MTDFFLGSISASTESQVELDMLLIAIGVALVLGLIISIAFLKAQKGGGTTKSFALTLAMLPAVVAVIIMLIGTNIAGAFSLAGAFSIIRFRSTAGSARDITYVLFSMAVGLACGLGYVGYAVITAFIFSLVMVILERTRFGESRTVSELLKITIPEDLDYKDAFTEVLQEYTDFFKLIRVKTTNLGSLYELEYAVETRKDVDEKEFIDELRCRNGNLNISLVLAPETKGF